MTTFQPFEDYEIRAGTDIEPDLTCPHCNEALVLVEHGDTLGTLVRTALDHDTTCESRPTP